MSAVRRILDDLKQHWELVLCVDNEFEARWKEAVTEGYSWFKNYEPQRRWEGLPEFKQPEELERRIAQKMEARMNELMGLSSIEKNVAPQSKLGYNPKPVFLQMEKIDDDDSESSDEEEEIEDSQEMIEEEEGLSQEDPLKVRAPTKEQLETLLDAKGVPREWYWVRAVKDMEGKVVEHVAQPVLVGGVRRKGKKKKPMKKMRQQRNNLRVGPVTQADSITVRLRWPFEIIIYSLASQQASVRYVANGPFDVDPLTLSTSMPGFSEYSALYLYNRVISYSMVARVANLEAVPVSLFLINDNQDPGTSGINWNSYSSNSRCSQYLLAASTAQPAKTISCRLRVQDLVGSKQVLTDPTFQGAYNANPSDKVYVGIGARISTGNLSNGVMVQAYLEMVVRFYDRVILTA